MASKQRPQRSRRKPKTTIADEDTDAVGQQPAAAAEPEVEDRMRAIFDDSQRVDKHRDCLQRMRRLQLKYSASNVSVKDFYRELIRNLKYALWVPDSRSPHTHNTIAFFVRYLLTFSANITTDAAALDGGGDDLTIAVSDDADEVRHEFIDAILEDVVIPYTNSAKIECRINSCHFIRRLFDELADISNDIFDKMRKALLDRSADKTAGVRAAAVLALHRFQDTSNLNDLVIQAIHFHLNYDPDPEVRHNCLKVMAASKESLTHFVGSTRDIKDFIRKTAYVQIAEKIQIKCFTIEQRLTILKNGLKDRSSAVRKVVEAVLIPSWVKCCNNNLIQLLIALDIQTDIDLIEKMLDIYFKHLNRELASDVLDESSSKTKFHQLVDEFCQNNMSKDRLFSVAMNVENVFLWRYLCEFCKTNQIQRKDIPTPEETNDLMTDNIVDNEPTIQQSMATSDEIMTIDDQIECQTPADDIVVQNTVDLFDQLVPDVPYFCAYIEKFVNNVITEELTIADALDFEFIFNQFMKVSLLLDIGDDAQRKILVKTMRSILIDSQIGDKFHGFRAPVMKCLAKIGFTDKNAYLDFTVEIISEIFATIVSTVEETFDSVVDESNRELEDKRNKLDEDLKKWQLELQDMEGYGQTPEAQALRQKIDECEAEINVIKDKIVVNSTSLSQSSQTLSIQPKSLPSFADHPQSLMSCLQIFSSCLEFGNYSEVNAVMQTHIEKVCLPGFLSGDISVRRVATRCLGLVCLTSPQYFKKYLHLLIEIFLKDIDEIKIIALQSIFDSLCEHGITIFDDKVDKNGVTSEDNSQVRQLAFDDSNEDFITSLKQFFESQLESDSMDVRETAVQGIAKLLMHSRLYSPELLSKLIVIWFTPDEYQPIVQFIGDFLRLYSLAESQGVIVGQSALQESFLLTLQTLYDQRLKRINSESLIKFFLNLIDDDSHTELAKDLVKRILECDNTQNKLAEDYLLLAVNHLNLVSMTGPDMKTFSDDIQKIVDKFESSKSKTVKKRLTAIIKNIENRCQQLSADTAFEQDFEPIDDINDTVVDKRRNRRDNTTANDSDAESFRTCPESQSPQQKRRRMTTEEDIDIDDENDTDKEVVANGGADDQQSSQPSDDVQDLEANTSELSLNETNTDKTIVLAEESIAANDTSAPPADPPIVDPFMTVD